MTTPASQESKTSKTETSKTEAKSSGLCPTKYPGNPKKREVKDKSYDWIAGRMASWTRKDLLKRFTPSSTLTVIVRLSLLK